MTHQAERPIASSQASRNRGCSMKWARFFSGLGGGPLAGATAGFSCRRKIQNSAKVAKAAALASAKGIQSATWSLR
jgi:hypothetical protein